MDFNQELEKEIMEFHEKSDINNYDNILNLLPYCILRTPTYLAEDPKFDEKGGVVIEKSNTLIFNIIEDEEGNKYLPVFTSQKEYEKMPNIDEASIYHLEFHHIIDLFSVENDMAGIAINPAANNVTIEKEVLFELKEILEEVENQDF